MSDATVENNDTISDNDTISAVDGAKQYIIEQISDLQENFANYSQDAIIGRLVEAAGQVERMTGMKVAEVLSA